MAFDGGVGAYYRGEVEVLVPGVDGVGVAGGAETADADGVEVFSFDGRAFGLHPGLLGLWGFMTWRRGTPLSLAPVRLSRGG